MSTMPSVGSGTYSPGPNMVCSPEQEKVGTGSIEAIIYPVYTISESALQCHNSSLRLTTEESNDIEDVIQVLKRQLKVKTSLNEVARLGLLYLVHDFKEHRERSLIYRVKQS